MEIEQGLRPDVVFSFDLELPPSFRPVNTDGEVAAFYRWPIQRVLETVRDTERFKFNCALVVIDFLLRHGHIARSHPEHDEIVRALRCGTSGSG